MSAETIEQKDIDTSNLLNGNILHADPLGVTNRRIDRLGDDIASAQMFGGDTAAKDIELQGEIDMRDYLMSRDYKDKDGNIHDAETNQFKSLENANRIDEKSGERYEDMTVNGLIDKWAQAEDNNDRTTSTNVQDELQERLLKIPTIAEENSNRDEHGVTETHKMKFIDVMYNEMMSRRKNVSNPNATGPANIAEPKAPDNASPSIEIDNSTSPIEAVVTGPGTATVAEAVPTEVGNAELPVADPVEIKSPDPIETIKIDDSLVPPAGIEPIPVDDKDVDVSVDEPVVAEAKNESLSYVHANVDKAINQAAYIEAENRMNTEVTKGGRFRQIINKSIFGKGGSLLRSTYVGLYQLEAAKNIKEQYEKFKNHELVGDRAKYIESIIEQFKLDEAEAIDEDAGERREIHTDDKLTDRTKELVSKFAKGEINLDELKQQRDDMMRTYRAEFGTEDLGAEGETSADNLVEVAIAAASMYEHGKSLENIFVGFNVRTGEALTGARSEAKYNVAEKAVNWLSSKKLGWIVPTSVTIAAVTMALSLSRLGSQKIINSATMLGGVSTAAGVWAGLARNKDLKKERYIDAVQTSENMVMQDGDKKREKLVGFRYETLSAAQTNEALRSMISEDKLRDNSDAVIDAIVALAAIEARTKESSTKRIDLWSYSSEELRVKERSNLAITRSEAKRLLDAYFTPEVKAALGVPEAQSFDETLQEEIDLFTAETLEADVSAKDEAFNKWKLKESLKAGAKAMIIAAGVGLMFQEIKAAFDSNLTGVFDRIRGNNDNLINGEHHYTLLGGIGAKEAITQINPNGKMATEIFGKNGQATIPEGYKLVNDGTGKFNFVDASGNGVKGLVLDQDGKLSNSAVLLLEKAGMKVDQSKSLWINSSSTKTSSIPIDDYIKSHPGDFKDILRHEWYDELTPGKHELNELGTNFRGGVNGTGIAANGDIQCALNMTSEGSFNASGSVDALQEIKNGNLYAVITADRTPYAQAHGIIVQIDKAGHINIPKGSPAYDWFTLANNKLVGFKGGLIEIFEKIGGAGKDGIKGNILSTVVGDHSIKTVSDTITTNIDTLMPKVEITLPNIDKIVPNFFEVPPAIPIDIRESMKGAKPAAGPEIGYGYGYGGEDEMSEAEVAKMTNERSPRLMSNFEAALNPQQELDWYSGELLKRRGQDGFEKLDQKVNNSKELSEMSGDVETIVTVPVAAAQEADTIFDTLSLYGRQSIGSLYKSMILINLNWTDTAMADPAKKAAIDKARSEIERARVGYPNIKIAVVENEYDSESIDKTGGVIGYVAADLMDTALLAIQKRMKSGVMAPDHEVLLIRNDADPEGMSRNYLEQYQKTMHEEKNKDIDVFKGITRFGVKWAEKYPGFAVASNFSAALSAMLSSRGLPATGGANFAIKSSTLAAVGGLGVMTRTGAGSDDGALGRRIRLARWGVGVVPRDEVSQSSVLPNGKTVPYRAVATHVFGATVDTNPSRLVPYYINGRPYSDAWGSDFSSSKDGYTERSANMAVTSEGKSEIANDWNMQVQGIEKSVTSELYWNGVEECSRALFIFFGHIPGCYTYERDKSGHPQFKFTEVGKKYLKKRFEKEHYGRNLMSLYKVHGPRGINPPLISPV